MAIIRGNYHTHSLYSDGKAPLEDYIAEAVSQGLEYLGFSEHSPLPFENSFALREGKISEYVQEVRALAKDYKGGPVLFAGLEMDYIPGISENFAIIKKQYKLDYLIGSVHLVLNEDSDGLWFIDGPSAQIYDDGLEFYFQKDIRKAVTAYYRQLQDMIRNERIDIIGHLDKIKMHNQNRYFREDEDWYMKLVMETLEEITDKGVVVEVNTRGMYKKRSEELFPGLKILREIKQMNIPVIISSDAHTPSELTALFSETKAVIKSVGIKYSLLFTSKGWEESSL